MNKVRINDLARELEMKAKPILDALTALGVSKDKPLTHSSSIDADEAEKVRGYFKAGGRSSTANKPAADNKPKFDLSKVSKPGDALRAILERKQAEATIKSAPPPRPSFVVAAPPSSASAVTTPPKAAAAAAPPVSAGTSTAPGASPAPRRIVPLPRQQANIVAPAPPPAIASKPPVGPVIARPPLGENQVKQAGIQALVEGPGQADAQLDADQGIGRHEAAQNFRQAGQDEIFRDAKPNAAARGYVGEMVGRALTGLDDVARETRHDIPVGGQGHRVGVSRQQLTPGRLFKPADVLADCRLAQSEGLAGGGELLGLNNSQEGA